MSAGAVLISVAKIASKLARLARRRDSHRVPQAVVEGAASVCARACRHTVPRHGAC